MTLIARPRPYHPRTSLALTPGTRLGPYEVVAQTGVGEMGEVYRATDTKLKRQVALKISTSAGSSPRWRRDGRERFYMDRSPFILLAHTGTEGRGRGLSHVRRVRGRKAFSDSASAVERCGQPDDADRGRGELGRRVWEISGGISRSTREWDGYEEGTTTPRMQCRSTAAATNPDDRTSRTKASRSAVGRPCGAPIAWWISVNR